MVMKMKEEIGNFKTVEFRPKNSRVRYSVYESFVKRYFDLGISLFGTYEDSYSSIRAICKNHHEFSTTANQSRLVKTGCAECLKTSIDVIREKYSNYGYMLLDESYENESVKMKCKCLVCGCESFISYSAIRNSWESRYGCRGHRKSKRTLTIGHVKTKCSELRKDITIIDDTYIKSNVKLKCFCFVCNKEIYMSWDNIKNFKNCGSCRKINASKENHPMWKGGVQPIHVFLRGNISDWKKKSMINCGYKCDVTGKRFDDIHHIHGFDSILEEVISRCGIEVHKKNSISDYTEDELNLLVRLSNEIHNKYPLGVCLTKDVHNLFHKIYGFGNNTPEQYYEFKENYIKGKIN